MSDYWLMTSLVSLVLSIFMLGLGLGSWGAPHLVKRWAQPLSLVRLSALTELLIGISALMVPLELTWGRQILERLEPGGLSSSGFYLMTGIWISLSLVPWCACMGATFPFAMSAIKAEVGAEAPRSFSYLYLANVFGAVWRARFVSAQTMRTFCPSLSDFDSECPRWWACHPPIGVSPASVE